MGDSMTHKNEKSHTHDRHLDALILRALRQGGTVGVSGAELAHRLGVTRAAIWARIESLRELGFEIDANPHHGYRLISSPDVLLADDLIARLERVRTVGRDIVVFKETASTNDVADQLAHSGAVEGTVIFAEAQTRGRGRLGRRWFSPPGRGIWMSVILRPPFPPHQVTRLTLMSAVAARDAIQRVTGLSPAIKWPNDIVISGKKVAGILTEMTAEQERILHAIVGIGINVNITKQELPQWIRTIATSLQIELGHPVFRPSLAAELITQIDRWYHLLLENGFDRVIKEWQTHCTTIGKFVEINSGSKKILGFAECVDDDGALLVRTGTGRVERIIGGDVTLEKQS